MHGLAKLGNPKRPAPSQRRLLARVERHKVKAALKRIARKLNER